MNSLQPEEIHPQASHVLDESLTAVSQRTAVPVVGSPRLLLGVGCCVAANARRQTNMSKPELLN